jgi:hypothetical protein
MESTFRPEVQAFIQNCQKLAGLTHQNELTYEEGEAIVNFARGLLMELAPSPPLLDLDVPAATPLSNVPRID